jgi:acetylornithine/succinyldiaminopimelate/putrescine aminotransferase
MSYPGGNSTRYNIDPDFAAMIAAGHYAEDAISRAIMRAQEMRPHSGKELTQEERDAWNNFVRVMGDRGRYIEVPSAREATEAGIKAMMLAAKEMFETNPSVAQAYHNLLTLAALAKNS